MVIASTAVQEETPTAAEASAPEESIPSGETTVVNIQKYGNLDLDVTASDLFALGYEYGDMLTATVIGKTMNMPLVSNFTGMDSGALICRAAIDEATGEDSVALGICMSDLATSLGIATRKTIEEEPGYVWEYTVDTPITVTLTMLEKGGYQNDLLAHQLVRSNERSDYL